MIMRKVEDRVYLILDYCQQARTFLDTLTPAEFNADAKTIAATSMMVIAIAEQVEDLPENF